MRQCLHSIMQEPHNQSNRLKNTGSRGWAEIIFLLTDLQEHRPSARRGDRLTAGVCRCQPTHTIT